MLFEMGLDGQICGSRPALRRRKIANLHLFRGLPSHRAQSLLPIADLETRNASIVVEAFLAARQRPEWCPYP
jgi:hypothetical protein